MSEFDEALAQSVQDGIARGGLPGAADAVRRGRRRSLRARGGVTLLGVAVVAGALGGAGVLGGGAGSVGVGAGSSVHADEGILPVAQWPGYDLGHWKLSAACAAADRSKCRAGDPTDDVKQVKVGEYAGQCGPGASFQIRRFVQFGTQYDTAHKLDANEIVFTFADGDAAAAFMADARTAVSARGCAGVPGAEATSPGLSTAGGVSWVVTQQDGGVNHLPSVGHQYLVQADNRVALLRVMQFGTDFQSTVGDAKVLAEMQQALEN